MKMHYGIIINITLPPAHQQENDVKSILLNIFMVSKQETTSIL